MTDNYEKEKQEAIETGKKALSSLRKAQEYLDSARGWGIYDLIGGGLISTIVKHDRMNKARQYILNARDDLRCFQNELADLNGIIDINLDTQDAWGFADILFDGLITDMAMQSRINNARNDVDQTIRQVESILESLNSEGE